MRICCSLDHWHVMEVQRALRMIIIPSDGSLQPIQMFLRPIVQASGEVWWKFNMRSLILALILWFIAALSFGANIKEATL